jgi:hypothetical protein
VTVSAMLGRTVAHARAGPQRARRAGLSGVRCGGPAPAGRRTGPSSTARTG